MMDSFKVPSFFVTLFKPLDLTHIGYLNVTSSVNTGAANDNEAVLISYNVISSTCVYQMFNIKMAALKKV